MASIRKHGSAWQVRWREGGRGSPLLSRRAPTKAVALDLKRTIERNLALYGTAFPEAGARAAPAVYLHHRLTAWRDALLPRLRPRTVSQYQDAAEVLLDYLAERLELDREAIPVGALDREALTGWHGWLLQHGRTRTTAAKRVQTLTLAWRWMYDGPDRDVLTPPPFLPLARSEPRRDPTAATWAQADACVAATAHLPWLHRLAILARFTGLRRSEMLLLRTDDLVLGGDVPEARLRNETTKGGRAGRTIPLSPHLAELARTWPGTPDGYLIDAPEPERVAARGDGRGHVDRNFRRAWARAGVPVEVWHGRPIHGFRHVLETELRAAGGDWLGIETLVGHVAPGTGGAFYLAARANWPAMLAAVRLIPPLTVPAEPRKPIPFPGSRR